MSKVTIDDRQVWCVCWRSPSRRSASYWYFEHEAEAAVAHERLQNWDNTDLSGGEHGSSRRRG